MITHRHRGAGSMALPEAKPFFLSRHTVLQCLYADTPVGYTRRRAFLRPVRRGKGKRMIKC